MIFPIGIMLACTLSPLLLVVSLGWMDVCIYIYIYPRSSPRNWTSVHGTKHDGEKQILIQCLFFADYSTSLATNNGTIYMYVYKNNY